MTEHVQNPGGFKLTGDEKNMNARTVTERCEEMQFKHTNFKYSLLIVRHLPSKDFS